MTKTTTGFHDEQLENERKLAAEIAAEALAQAVAQRDEAERKEAEAKAFQEKLQAEHKKNASLAEERGF
jgi:hypothetical protein